MFKNKLALNISMILADPNSSFYQSKATEKPPVDNGKKTREAFCKLQRAGTVCAAAVFGFGAAFSAVIKQAEEINAISKALTGKNVSVSIGSHCINTTKSKESESCLNH